MQSTTKSRLLTLQFLLILGVAGIPALAQCPAPLDDQTLRSLQLGTGYPTLQVKPGETVDLSLYRQRCCVFFDPVDACVTWSVYPDWPARIDPRSGILTVDPRLSTGYFLVVTANIENGRRVLSIPVYIYKPEDNPLVGVWREKERFSCKSGALISDSPPIGELVFRADGTMWVTRVPFEIYHDWWGSYLIDLKTRAIGFAVRSGSQIPTDVDGFGRFRLDENGALILHKLSLGRFSTGDRLACRYEFERVGRS